MAALPLTGNALQKEEMEYNGKMDTLLEGYDTFLL